MMLRCEVKDCGVAFDGEEQSCVDQMIAHVKGSHGEDFVYKKSEPNLSKPVKIEPKAETKKEVEAEKKSEPAPKKAAKKAKKTWFK